AGWIRLPELPVGDILKVTIDHPRFAPVWNEEAAIAPGLSQRVMMRPGVVVTLRAKSAHADDRITRADIDLRHEPHDHPSTRAYAEVEFDAEGVAHLNVAPGTYSFFRLENEEFLLTPIGSHSFSEVSGFGEDGYRFETGRNDDLSFELRRKVRAKGRVVN